MTKKIVLIGPPGAGKTSIGKALSKELELAFIDSDAEIERISGKTISEIFVDQGEAVFRKTEVETVTRILAEFEGVVALGGGAPINPEIKKFYSIQSTQLSSLMYQSRKQQIELASIKIGRYL